MADAELNHTAWNAAIEALDQALHSSGIKTNGVPVTTLAGIAVRAYLSALTAAGEAVPVCWRYRERYPRDPELDAKVIARDDNWSYGRKKPGWPDDGSWEAQPLYASPPPMPSDETVEAAAIRMAASANLVWDELEEHGSDGENKTTFRRRARGAIRSKP
jgi:L-alanine-DL-glutamate epimerase-like enolase superfamily enzyme